MSQEHLRYDRMIEDALRGVVRQALTDVAKHGLFGEHHFFITFRTGHPGVDISEHLRRQYPETMTIVLQYQFWGLEVQARQFAVTLSFNDRQERLVIPFSAVTAFADPSVKFGLEFQARDDEDGAVVDEQKARAEPAKAAAAPAAERDDKDKSKTADVVALDKFRKK